MYDRFNYNPKERTEKIIRMCEEREFQKQFREEVIKRDRLCLITYDNSTICEECHIIPYSETKSYERENGILLNRCFHKLFDDYDLSINFDNCIEFSDKIKNLDSYYNYLKYENLKININTECRKYLNIHYNRFLENNISNKI